MFFLFKKAISALLMPLPLALGILTLGLMVLWFTRRERTGKVLITAGTLLLGLGSFSPVSGWFLRSLEQRYPSLLDPASLTHHTPPIKWVVVLGGGNSYEDSLPVTSHLSSSSLARLVEGILLHRAFPGTRLLLSGGKTSGPVSEARSMADLALLLGVGEKNMALEENSLDTKDQALQVRKFVGGNRFLLVTSAYHMPRAAALFEGQGLQFIPAPAGHHVSPDPSFTPWDLIPETRSLVRVDLAIHERLGLVWAKLRGQLD